MKKLLFTLLLLWAAATAPGLAEETLEGRISTIGEDGSVMVNFASTADIQSRDVFEVVQKGKVIGECLVMSVSKSQVKMLTKGGFKATARVGDTVRFVRHAEVPVDGTEGWKRWNSPDGKFSVILPSPPGKTDKKHYDGANGSEDVTVYLIADGSDAMVYEVETHDFVLDKSKHYYNDEAQLGFITQHLADSMHWNIKWNRPITMQDHSAREIEATVASAALRQDVVLRAKLCWVGGRLYMLTAMATKTPGISSRCWKFLNSLELTEKGKG